jgi:MoaA/NifB/PqqE/SkfB family radical SAM enzyme
MKSIPRGSNGYGLLRILGYVSKVWGREAFKIIWKTRALQSGIIRSRRRRRRIFKEEGLQVPIGIGLSPTTRCNFHCEGCYSRFHSRDGEMSIDTIESVISSASEMGVFLFVITGGEPYMRSEMMDIYEKHQEVLFLTITNGSLIDKRVASDIAGIGNVFPVVSIEGTPEQTEARRGAGAYQKALECTQVLRNAGVPFGFSAMVTRSTVTTLGSSGFLDDMIDLGCVAGFFNEFIPMTSEELSALPDESQRSLFRNRLALMRKEKPILLVHLPDDEYSETGRCIAVGSGAVHINAQGDVEPCPFAHFACENVNDSSFREILRSPFLQAIRKHPTALQRGDIGCSLVSNHEVLEEIAGKTGARRTGR